MTCNALVIDEIHIKRCCIETENEFCEQHNFKKYVDSECVICYENIDTNIEVFLRCGHIYHRNCLYKSKIDKCPYCNKSLEEDELKYFTCGSDNNNLKYDEQEAYLATVINNYNTAINTLTMLKKLSHFTLAINSLTIAFMIYKKIKF